MVTLPAESSSNDQILFFDGVCGLCNGFVDWLLKVDKQKSFTFSPLQGETAQRTLNTVESFETAHPASVVVMPKSSFIKSTPLQPGFDLFTKSDAVLRVLTVLGGKWNLVAKLLQLFPRSLRDAVYDLVAKYRYRIWGKRETCRLPSPAERARFLP